MTPFKPLAKLPNKPPFVTWETKIPGSSFEITLLGIQHHKTFRFTDKLRSSPNAFTASSPGLPECYRQEEAVRTHSEEEVFRWLKPCGEGLPKEYQTQIKEVRNTNGAYPAPADPLGALRQCSAMLRQVPMQGQASPGTDLWAFPKAGNDTTPAVGQRTTASAGSVPATPGALQSHPGDNGALNSICTADNGIWQQFKGISSKVTERARCRLRQSAMQGSHSPPLRSPDCTGRALAIQQKTLRADTSDRTACSAACLSTASPSQTRSPS
ncbi:hypothetical protein Anapl_00136 [Anas platyrhynchos]|uniref:Uncharacterized protein n=1 Tax=Anas platyrhynchos TaxID=8839 RepID=R0K2F1_ANAPL|nr:hypothetical protein Anapl_00136 [Anas platyrhynchos]